MKRIKNLIAVSAFSLLVLGLPAVASAQWGGGYGNNGGYYGNNGYNIKNSVRGLKDRARSFERAVDRSDDRYDRRNDRGWGNGNWGNWGGNGNPARLESLADDFRKATDRLEKKYGNGRNLNNSADEARRVLDIASEIDREIYNVRGGNIQNQWNMMRNDLNIIANTYGYNYNNRGNRRGNRNGNWRNNVPFPLPF